MPKKLPKRKKYRHYRINFPNHQLIKPFKEKPESHSEGRNVGKLLPHALFQIFTAKVIEVDQVYYR
jgi:hypothetical protein